MRLERTDEYDNKRNDDHETAHGKENVLQYLVKYSDWRYFLSSLLSLPFFFATLLMCYFSSLKNAFCIAVTSGL